MKKFKFFAAVMVCAGVMIPAAPAVRAQIKTEPGTTVIVKQKPEKAGWLRAEVIHADRHTMMVRETNNEMAIHTFTYSAKVQEKMNRLIDDGGYQSGDHVKIRWLPGGTEAIDIKGKPSKAI
jgi:hypothetical protein